MIFGRMTQPNSLTSWIGVRLPSWATQFLTWKSIFKWLKLRPQIEDSNLEFQIVPNIPPCRTYCPRPWFPRPWSWFGQFWRFRTPQKTKVLFQTEFASNTANCRLRNSLSPRWAYSPETNGFSDLDPIQSFLEIGLDFQSLPKKTRLDWKIHLPKAQFLSQSFSPKTLKKWNWIEFSITFWKSWFDWPIQSPHNSLSNPINFSKNAQ